jgi:hypothetical protein
MGCSVELRKLRPPGHEPSMIASIVPAGGSILELGARGGRVTHPLLPRPYRVCAADNFAEMLAQIKGAETVISDIEDLALGSAFDAVLLGSSCSRETYVRFALARKLVKTKAAATTTPGTTIDASTHPLPWESAFVV